jgi:hypothetical protein
MIALYLILFVIAAVLFALAAFGVPVGRLNLVAAGLFCWVLVSVIQQFQKI